MAYGVKYRLEFSDVLGYGKKVEILSKNYTGVVLPMIGGANPVTIKWSAKDEFYKPLIGSQCTLNLMVTDTVKYDDFYKFDERQYKVKVSYSKSISETYANRVIANAGIYESLECVDAFFGDYFYKISTIYNNRINNDEGIIESLSCVSNAINDERVNVWADYWVGWLVVDRFRERMTTTPFSISFNAFDGIGTLGNYNSPITPYVEGVTNLGLTDLQRISQILQNLDLDLDIIFINDLNFVTSGGTGTYPNQVTLETQKFELVDGLNLYTAKKQLELILTMYNMRIYQSFGKWYIVENSNNFDSTIKLNIRNGNTTQSPITNIRENITRRLNSLENEFILSPRYNYLGVFQQTENNAPVQIAPKHLVPINNNLNREFLQPLQSVNRELQTTQFAKSFYNVNPGFEYGLGGWVVQSGRAVIEENGIDKQGAKAIKLNASTSGNLECIASKNVNSLFNSIFPEIKYEMSFFIESTIPTLGMEIRFQIYSEGIGTAPDIYFNTNSGSWQSQSVINSFENFTNNQFVNLSGKLTNPFGNGQGTANQQRYLKIIIFNTALGQTGAGYLNTFFDNVGFSQNNSQFYTVTSEFASEVQSKTNITGLRTDVSSYSASKSFSSVLAPGVAFNTSWIRSRDFANGTGGLNDYKTATNISNQNIMNDFREFCTRYSGSFRGKTPTPLTLNNKIWFNWKNVLTDPEPTIIDGMVYNVKTGEFNVVSHLPNNDNDLSISVRITD